MNFKMQLGADRKKVYWLIGLSVLAVILYFYNREPAGSAVSARPVATQTAPGVTGQQPPVRPVSRTTMRVTQSGIGRNSASSQINLKPKPLVNPLLVDPTLHLAALAKLQDVKIETGSRPSLFVESATPPAAVASVKEPPKIAIVKDVIGPRPAPPPPPPPPTPVAPKIPLKFYGFVNPARPDVKRAFFLDGEDIVIAGEGDLIKKRYKILRIGVNSAVVEDTTFKGDNTQQTLPLEAELPG
ncbi:MAG TPA: hypothetical protein VEU96_05310 [Bryobacteraceae bacterium]|nr:hypothetical protein [Bryobacteraceae bacterium]